MVTLTTRRIPTDNGPPAATPGPDSRAAKDHEVAAHLAVLGDERTRDLVQLFKLLADETRLRILYYLIQQDELNVRTLCKLLRQSQPAVSHHLALMRVAGIIQCRRDGKHNFYHVVPKRCQAYLETIFGGSGDQPRKVRVEDAVVSYVRDGLGE